MKKIEVAAAIIMDGDKVFATQRGYGEFKDWWEFPGGKIEAGESPQTALRREIREELGTEISIGPFLCAVDYAYPEFSIRLHCYICSAAVGSLVLKEHEAAKWLSGENLDSVGWLPADREVILKLKEYLSGGKGLQKHF